MDLADLSARLREEFEAKTAARERGLAASRNAIRACGNAIRAMHRHELDPARALLDEAKSGLDDARSVLKPHPELLHAGFVHDAEKEFAEAQITFALITDAPLPSPDSLGIGAAPFVKGMAESIGEMRRHILDLMRRGELKRGEDLLAAVDEMYYVLVSMDYPDGITLGLRRLTDVARSIVERTRGDFTTSTVQNALREALTEHTNRLDDR